MDMSLVYAGEGESKDRDMNMGGDGAEDKVVDGGRAWTRI